MLENLDRRKILAISIFLAVGGIALDAIAANLDPDTTTSFLLESVGVGLIASGFVNFFDKLLVETPKEPEIGIIAMERARTNPSIHQLKYEHEKVDILGVSIAAVLREFTEDPQNEMVDRVIRHNTRLRLICVHPESPFLRQRAREDRVSWDDLHARQIASVERVVKFYKMLYSSYQREHEAGTIKHGNVGSVEVRLINDCPYISLYRVDDAIYWGMYTTSKSGHESPLFLSNKQDKDGMFELLKDHLYALLSNEGADELTLISMPMKDHPPKLNVLLAEQILGKERVVELLK
jgi:hypothetical protein